MAKSILICINVALVLSAVCGEVPSFVKICGRRNPNLGECVKNSVESLREKLRDGIPELKTPAVEPLDIPGGLTIADTESFKAHTKNIKLYGVSTFQINNLTVDLEKRFIDIDVFFKKIKVEGDYDIDARIVVPIQAVGPIEIDSDDVDAKATLNFQLVTRKNKQYLFFSSIKLKVTVKDFNSHYVPKPGQDSTFSEVVNNVLNSSKDEILHTITSGIEKAISQRLLEVANKICKSLPYDEVLPDRE